MAHTADNDDGPELATINRITPSNSAAKRFHAGYVILLLVCIAVIALIARHVEPPLDVYRTIPELEIPDAALKECVVATATERGWANVGLFTSLRCNNPSGKDIRDLTGIEHLVELTDVNLAFNAIADATPLAALPNLAIVDLSHNRIRQLPVFRSAHALKRMDLNYNLLDSLAWLTTQHFPQLDSLSIAHNNISDLAGLELITELQELNVRGNRLTSLQAITSLRALFMLDAGENMLDDLGDIGTLVELRRLFLDGNRFSNIEGLGPLHNLEELNLENNTLDSTAPIAQLARLQRLNLNQSGITSLGDILALGDIELLRISANPGLDCASITAAIAQYGEAAIKYDQPCAAAAAPDQANQ